MEYTFDYGALLDECLAFHGHLCMGRVLGVRVAAKGLDLSVPESPKDLIAAVEVDRCLEGLHWIAVRSSDTRIAGIEPSMVRRCET